MKSSPFIGSLVLAAPRFQWEPEPFSLHRVWLDVNRYFLGGEVGVNPEKFVRPGQRCVKAISQPGIRPAYTFGVMHAYAPISFPFVFSANSRQWALGAQHVV